MHVIGHFHHLASLLLIKNFFKSKFGFGFGQKHYRFFVHPSNFVPRYWVFGWVLDWFWITPRLDFTPNPKTPLFHKHPLTYRKYEQLYLVLLKKNQDDIQLHHFFVFQPKLHIFASCLIFSCLFVILTLMLEFRTK